jgi:HK97 family phage portal protein
MLRQSIALGLAQEEYAGRFHANNARPNIALVSPSTVKDPEQLRREWERNYGGLANTGKVSVLHGGLDIKTFSINPKDAQFLEGRSFQLSEIARIFNVPIGLLHDTLSKPETYASAEQSDLRFVKYSVRPWCVRIEQKINTTVLSSQDALTCKHDLTDLLRGDLLTQAQAYTTLTNGGIATRNEARVRLDLPPSNDKEANKLTVQAQTISLSAVGSVAPITSAPVTPQSDPDTDIET